MQIYYNRLHVKRILFSLGAANDGAFPISVGILFQKKRMEKPHILPDLYDLWNQNKARWQYVCNALFSGAQNTIHVNHMSNSKYFVSCFESNLREKKLKTKKIDTSGIFLRKLSLTL